MPMNARPRLQGAVAAVLVVCLGLFGVACGGPNYDSRDYVRQGATALEVALPESAERLLERFTGLLDLVEGELESGGEVLAAVTAFVEAEGEGLREDTVAVRQAMEAMEPGERRAFEERVGEAFLEANRRWHGLRQRIAREHAEDANAIFQRVIQLNPAA